MASFLVAQASLGVLVGCDASARQNKVGFKAHCLRFHDKRSVSLSSLGLQKTNQSRHLQKVLCLSVQQASKSKVAVTPLELEDPKEPPLNLYKPKEPYTATIVSVERLVGPKAPGETCHIVIDHGGNVPYWEGQSYGIIPPGENPKKPGMPNNVRLYSIASTRYGDSFDGKTASLCVRRALYYDPETGKEDPSKKGVCSNFLCDSKPGDKIQLTGPSGKVMLLPEDDPKATHIMIATGTGVAPFRGYLRRMFMEAVPTFKFSGLAWLFLGVANSDSLLYDDEFTSYVGDYPDNFRLSIIICLVLGLFWAIITIVSTPTLGLGWHFGISFSNLPAYSLTGICQLSGASNVRLDIRLIFLHTGGKQAHARYLTFKGDIGGLIEKN